MDLPQIDEPPTAFGGEPTRWSTGALGALERHVLRLSFGDSRSSVGGAGRLLRFAALLSTQHRQTRLMDERLEALRRYAVLYRLDGERLSPIEDAALRRNGFDRILIEEIRHIVDRHVARPDHRARVRLPGLATVALAAGALCGVAVIVQHVTDDVTITAIISSLIAVTAASLHHSAARK